MELEMHKKILPHLAVVWLVDVVQCEEPVEPLQVTFST